MLSDVATDSRLLGYRIPPHVHVCVTAEGSVLLDLRQDKYFGFGRRETEILAEAVAEWPKPPWKTEPHLEREAGTLCLSMLERRLLAPSQEGATRAALALNQGRIGKAPPRDMRGDWISIGDEIEVRSSLSRRHWATFLSAYVWARYSLAFRPIFITVEEIRKCKEMRRDHGRPLSVLEVASMVDSFRQLRPFAFAAEGHCLLHALTLIRFLSKYAFYPDWVFGVTTQPWGAHTWVQWRDFLLDTNPEKVCAYTPILIV
jgi:hypothetical protein